MNGEKISRCLDALPDTMLEEAMKPYQPRSLGRHIFRIAACLALVVGLLISTIGLPLSDSEYVSAPGILAVTVHAATAKEPTTLISIPLEKGVEIPEQAFLGSTNSYVGVPTYLSVATDDFPSDKISYHISGTAGDYAHDDRRGYTQDWFPSLTCENNSTFRYNLMHGAAGNWYDDQYDRTFTKIVIYCDRHIIGYAVIQYDRLYTDEWAELRPEMKPHYEDLENPLPLDVFYCTLIESVSFPKVDGKYQRISQEYVEKCMQAIIDSQ